MLVQDAGEVKNAKCLCDYKTVVLFQCLTALNDFISAAATKLQLQ